MGEYELMMVDDEVLNDILEHVDQIDGIILLDLVGIQSTWGEHLKEIQRHLVHIRALCGDEDTQLLVEE